MAASVRSVSALATGSNTSITITKPAGTAAGDVLVAIIWQDSDGNPANLGTTLPDADWTLVGSIAEAGTSPYAKVWWKLATASEPANYRWGTSTGASMVGGILACRDVNPTSPIRTAPNTAAASSSGTGTSGRFPATTGGLAGDLLIGSIAAQGSSGRSFSTAADMTDAWDQTSTWVGSSTQHQVLTADGSTAVKTVTVNSSPSGNWRSFSLVLNGFVAAPITASDAGTGTDTPTVDKTRVQGITDTATGTDAVDVFQDRQPLTDAGTGADAVAVDDLVLNDLTDAGTGADAVEVVLFDANDLTDAGTGDDPATVDRLTFVPVADAGTGTDDLLLRQDKTATDAGTGTDLIGMAGQPALTDQGYGSEFVRVVDIPFTRVLPLAQRTLYELVVVARVPQVQGPPALIEVDSIEWKDLRYSNTLSQPQELDTSCQLSSVPESILQRLRRPHENATELWLYRNGQIVFAGPLAGWRTSGESLSLSAKGLLIYLRLMEVTSDLVFTQADQFTFVKTMVDAWQVLDFGNFGIDTSAVGLSGVLRDGTYLKVELHNVGQRVEELGKRENGFDAEVDPATRKLQLWYPTKGVNRSTGEDAIVVDARNITNGDTMCSVAIGDLASEAFGTGTSAGGDAPLWSAQSNAELRSRYGRSAVTGTWSDVSEQPTLDAHTRGLLDARKEALIVPGPAVRVTPDADLDDYAVGDTITYDLAGVLGVSGAFRIRRQSVSVSSAGQESVDLEFV